MSNFEERLKSCVVANDLNPVLSELLMPDNYYNVSPDIICSIPLNYAEEVIRLFSTTHVIDTVPDFVDVCILYHEYTMVAFLCERFNDKVLKWTKLGNMYLEQEEYAMALEYYAKAFDENGYAPVNLYAGMIRCAAICGDVYILQQSKECLKLALKNTKYPSKDFPLRSWSAKYALLVDVYVSGDYTTALDMCNRIESYADDLCPESLLLLDTLLLKGKCYLFENDIEAATNCFSRVQRIAAKYMSEGYSKLDEAIAFICVCDILSGLEYPSKLDDVIMKHTELYVKDHLADRLSVFEYAYTKDDDILMGVREYYTESFGKDCYFVKLLDTIVGSNKAGNDTTI